jgi:hypothetical protein
LVVFVVFVAFPGGVRTGGAVRAGDVLVRAGVVPVGEAVGAA